MRNEILNVILECVKEFNEQADTKIQSDEGESAKLFGMNGVLDSLGLVSFIVEVEQALEDKMDLTIQLVSEKAMSQKTSPFLTIGTLVDFIEHLIQEEGDQG